MKFVLSLLVPIVLFGASYDKLITYYKNQQYKKACVSGIKLFRAREKNEQIISLVGDSCARADYINILGEIQKYQKNTKKARENASYFTTILTQKRLIFQFMFDDLDLNGLKFPKTDHILSKVFINLSNNNFEIKLDKPKRVTIDVGDVEYILSISGNKIYIEEIKNRRKVMHRYN